MCDEQTLADDNRHLQSIETEQKLSRRQFGTLAGGFAALAAWMPGGAKADGLSESEVTVETPDGVADCFFVHPGEGKHPAVLVWPDVLGLRDAYRLVGRRLAGEGYSVLVVNPYYRTGKAPVVEPGASFQDEAVRNLVLPMARSLSPQTNATDAAAFIGWLDQQDSVDTNRGAGAMGYCMGGPMTLRTAATQPGRVRAGASFHGGGLVTDKLDSPHLSAPLMNAQFLIAVAKNDDERDPVAKSVLQQAFEAADISAEIEVYEAMHGWCTPDSRVYNEAEAERAWTRLLALYETALA